ncbi:MAG TPA: hypothetical protein VGB82_13575 [Alphaproteobacteria bacterium]
MTSIPPSSAVPPGATPLAVNSGNPAAPTSPAGGISSTLTQLPSDPGATGQGTGNAAPPPEPGPAAEPAATIAPSVTGGPVVVATIIGAARTSSAETTAPTPASAGGGAVPAAPAGTQVSLRFAGILPDLTAAAASASNGQLVGAVVGRTPVGQMIVDTAIGRLAINAAIAQEVAADAQIAFDIIAIVGRTAPAAAAAGTALPGVGGRGLSGLGREWPSLRKALEALAVSDPPLARQIMEIVLPRPGGARFLTQVLSFLSSPAADTAALLGEAAAESLQSTGRGDLVAGLDGDLREMSRLNASASEWLVFYVPFIDTTEPRQMRVFTRRRKGGQDTPGEGGGRFVVDVEFESVGALQLDGLVHKPRLDLILRSHVDLSPSLQAGIAGVFGQTCDAAGLIGKIFFQTLPSFPVSPLDEIANSAGPGLSV